jgi:hypothetical protein
MSAIGDRCQAPGGASAAIRLRGHEEAADRRRNGAWTGTRGLTRAKILASVAVDFSTLKAAGAVL